MDLWKSHDNPSEIHRRTGWSMAASRRIEETDAGCLSLAVGLVVDLAREST